MKIFSVCLKALQNDDTDRRRGQAACDCLVPTGAIMSQPMENLDVLISAGVMSENHTVAADHIEVVNEGWEMISCSET
jgi:hypothetical protein